VKSIHITEVCVISVKLYIRVGDLHMRVVTLKVKDIHVTSDYIYGHGTQRVPTPLRSYNPPSVSQWEIVQVQELKMRQSAVSSWDRRNNDGRTTWKVNLGRKAGCSVCVCVCVCVCIYIYIYCYMLGFLGGMTYAP
jgi:hypothetical protein